MKKIMIAFASLFFLTACEKDDDCQQTPQPACACYEIYAPVCGCDGVTYSNDCYAECNGITDYTPGECP